MRQIRKFVYRKIRSEVKILDSRLALTARARALLFRVGSPPERPVGLALGRRVSSLLVTCSLLMMEYFLIFLRGTPASVTVRVVRMGRARRWSDALSNAYELVHRAGSREWQLRLLSDVYRWKGDLDTARRVLNYQRKPLAFRRAEKLVESLDGLSPRVTSFSTLNLTRESAPNKVQLLKMVPMADLDVHSEVISDTDLFVGTSPRLLGQDVESESNWILRRPLHHYTIRDAVVTPLSSEVRWQDLVAFPFGENRYPKQHPVNLRGLSMVWENLNLVDGYSSSGEFEEAVFAGGTWAGNWYHWSAEVLPRLEFLVRCLDPAIPLLIPNRNSARPNFKSLLQLMFPERSIVELKEGSFFRIRKLHTLDSLSTLTNEAVGQPFPKPGSHRLHIEAFARYRNHLLTKIGVAAKSEPTPSRIYLDRRSGSSRAFNEKQVRQTAIKHGFVPVDMQTLDPIDQLRYFNGAKFVIGPSGAAWALSLACAPGTKGLIWGAAANVGTLSIWSNLMSTANSSLRAIPIDVPALDAPDVHRMRYRLAPDLLGEQLADLQAE